MLLIVGIAFGFKDCKKVPFTKSDYDKIRATEAIPLPDKLPNKYYSPRGVEVYSSIQPSAETMQWLDNGIQTTLDNTRYNCPPLEPIDTCKTWARYKTHSNTRVLLLPPMAYSNSVYKNCPLLQTHDGTKIIGIVIGIRYSGIYEDRFATLVLPQMNNLPADSVNCGELFTLGAKHEDEHLRLLNNSALFGYFTGANDIHPIFTGEQKQTPEMLRQKDAEQYYYVYSEPKEEK